ncbi:MAG: hypothetical protein MI974_14025 [Chitinophagales bacterium]|nr:hypothetical protein [Chitinophagales bacterium]
MKQRYWILLRGKLNITDPIDDYLRQLASSNGAKILEVDREEEFWKVSYHEIERIYLLRNNQWDNIRPNHHDYIINLFKVSEDYSAIPVYIFCFSKEIQMGNFIYLSISKLLEGESKVLSSGWDTYNSQQGILKCIQKIYQEINHYTERNHKESLYAALGELCFLLQKKDLDKASHTFRVLVFPKLLILKYCLTKLRSILWEINPELYRLCYQGNDSFCALVTSILRDSILVIRGHNIDQLKERVKTMHNQFLTGESYCNQQFLTISIISK